ncbi:hypothetical protein ABR737_43465 [Streptomyces sp. Edi2]
MTEVAPTRWVPPDPRELPEWRAQLVDYTASDPSNIIRPVGH